MPSTQRCAFSSCLGSNQIERIAQCFLLLGIGAIPISTSVMIIGLVTAALLVLLSGQWREKWAFFVARPALWMPVILFAWIAISVSHGEVPLGERIKMLIKYHGLLITPFIAWLFNTELIRKRALYVFLIAMLFVMTLSTLLYDVGNLVHDSTVFHDHISIGIFSAFSLFILACLYCAEQGYQKYLYLLAMLANAWYIMFINSGRTGYLVFFALFLLYGWQRRRLKGLIVQAVLAMILIAGVNSFSSVFHSSTTVASQDAEQYLAGKKVANNTASLRFVAMKSGLTLIKQHPLMGVGTGSFYQAIQSLPWITEATSSRHAYNDFINLAAQTGLMGGILVFLMYLVQWRAGARLPSLYCHLSGALIITMMVSGCLNPVLLDTMEAHFYSVFTAWCFAL